MAPCRSKILMFCLLLPKACCQAGKKQNGAEELCLEMSSKLMALTKLKAIFNNAASRVFSQKKQLNLDFNLMNSFAFLETLAAYNDSFFLHANFLRRHKSNTVLLTRFSDHPITRSPDHPISSFGCISVPPC